MTALKQYRIRASSKAELVRRVEAAVASGALTPGQRLPSVRRLAVETGLSPVDRRRRRSRSSAGAASSSASRAARRGSAPARRSARRARRCRCRPARAISRAATPTRRCCPTSARRSRAASCRARLYGEPQALPELLALAREQLRADGVPGEELCIAGGAMDAIERVLTAHLRPGDRVAVENPGYAALYDVLRAHGLVLEPVALDQRGMLPSRAAALRSRAAPSAR